AAWVRLSLEGLAPPVPAGGRRGRLPHPRACRPGGIREQARRRPLRRSAAARGHRPRARAAPAHPAGGRADLQPRPAHLRGGDATHRGAGGRGRYPGAGEHPRRAAGAAVRAAGDRQARRRDRLRRLGDRAHRRDARADLRRRAGGGGAGAVNATARAWRPPSAWPRPWLGPLVWLGLALFLAWNVASLEVNPERVARGLSRLSTVAARAFPPDFSRSGLLLSGIAESIEMATLSTLFGVLLGIPVAVLAARNVVPGGVYAGGRGVITLGRTFHELIVAILFVKAVGFGPLAGVLTLTVNSVGFFGKLLAEQIETIDRGQIEAVRATGAGRGAILLYAVLPQVLPRIIGLTIYQWDIHLRQSTIIGIVGAGGIGATLYNAFSRYDYDFVLAILLVIVAIVLVGEAVSALARRWVQ